MEASRELGKVSSKMSQSGHCLMHSRSLLRIRSDVASHSDLQTCRGISSKYFGYCRLHQNSSVQPAAPRASVPPCSTCKNVVRLSGLSSCFSKRPGMSNYGNVDGKGSCESFCRPSLSIKMQRSLRKMRENFQKITDSLQEDDKQSLYSSREELSTLTWRTGFSKDEIRRLYRAFKQFCPRGCATTGDLKPAYAKLFPLGDPTRYTRIVFHSFDKDGDGFVSFGDLLDTTASIVNGSVDQKLSWIFEFYDLNGDGCITKREMLVIISAIYEMVQDAQTTQSAIKTQVDKFFEKMDADRDGIVTREEFMSGCKNDTIIYNQLSLFNKIW